MSLWDAPVRDVRPLATEERTRLIRFLDGLAADEWVAPSPAPGWTVRDLALHLLDADLGWLSRERDGDPSGVVDMSDPQEFVARLAAKNQRWIDGGRGLSRRVVTDLLRWTGEQVDTYHASQDLRGHGWVSWASDGPVPYWFNLAQEFTERWVHQQQMREAVDRVEDHDALLPDVLRTFVWAFPHQLRVPAEPGSEVDITIRDVGTWTLIVNGDGRWSLADRPAGADAAARLSLSPRAAWRLFTAAPLPDTGVHAVGSPVLTEALMRVRAIIV